MGMKIYNRIVHVLIMLSIIGGFSVYGAEQSVVLVVPGCGA